VLVANELGLGGTEKGLVAHARSFDPERVEVRVVAARGLGPRAAELAASGIRVDCAEGDGARLAQLLSGAEVVHVFRGGGREPLVPEARRAAGVPHLVETNVFGQVDPAQADEFDCHLFVSKMCALRYRRRRGLEGDDFHRAHRVSHWPLDLERLRGGAPAAAAAKAALGLDPARPVVGRLGRDDDRKWRDLVVDMVPHLLRLQPDAQVLLVGATPAKLRRLERLGVLERVTFLPPTADEEELRTLYRACDVFVSAAEIGESYSVAICEALALGIPVVTCSTPWVDNGQIEQVESGVTGWVADHPRSFAEAVADILGDEAKRARFGAAAAATADRLWDAQLLTRQLEGLYAELARGASPRPWVPAPAEVDGFSAEYERRLAAQFRPLSGRERAEVAAERRRERMRWATRAAAGMDRERAALALSMLRARLQPARRAA
jgi:glycosyltransferase involved in cell wall biosynthesis